MRTSAGSARRKSRLPSDGFDCQRASGTSPAGPYFRRGLYRGPIKLSRDIIGEKVPFERIRETSGLFPGQKMGLQ